MQEQLIKIGEIVVDRARQKGVQAEAFLLYDRELGIEVAGGQIETLKEAEEVGLGIRVIKDGRLGFSYATAPDEQTAGEMVERALESSGYTSPDENNTLPAGEFDYPRLAVYEPGIRQASLEQKIDLARQVEESARAYDARITVVEKAAYQDSEFTMVVVNSEGIRAVEKGSFCGLYSYVVAEEDGDAQTGFSLTFSRHLPELTPEEVGREAAHNAVRMLQGKTITSGTMPCVLEPYVVTNFLGILANSVNADAVQKGKSLFAGKMGQEVAARELTLVDDSLYDEGIVSFPFDGEGFPAQRTVLVENGILQGFLYDVYTANKGQTRSTGNGARSSFRSLPGVGTTNFFFQAGSKPATELVHEVSHGLYITEVMGMHTANPISGDFSVGAAGLLIENGEVTHPVRGITIAGNLQDLLQDVDGVGDDLRFFGSRGAPTLRVKALSVAGE